MPDTTDLQTSFPLNEAQNQGIMRDVERLAQRTQEWLDSGGHEQLAAAMRRAEASGKAIQEALRPDPETLNKPMTI